MTRIDAVGTIVVAVFVVPLLVLLLARVAQLQFAPSVKLVEQMTARAASTTEHAPRGDILDARGRVLATTRHQRRVFLDPWRMHELGYADIESRIDTLHRFTRVPWEEIASVLYGAIDENRTRERLGRITGDGKGAKRYLPLGDVLSDERMDELLALELEGVHAELRPVREQPLGDAMAPLLGLVGFEHTGLSGVEHTLNTKLAASNGSLGFVRDAGGRPLWVSEGAWTPPDPGAPVRLTIDLELQRIAMEELQRGIDDAGAAGGRIVVVDPLSGDVLAMADIVRDLEGLAEFAWDEPALGVEIPEPSLDAMPRYRTLDLPDPESPLVRNRCAQDMYEPGSTFKPFVWAAATSLERVRRDEVLKTHNGLWRTPYGRMINDVSKRPTMNWEEVLVRSSNIGMAQGAARMSFDELRDFVLGFGFGRRTGIGLGGESTGMVTKPKDWSKYTQTSVSFGHEVAVTPLQMARAFCVFARDGERGGTIPSLRLVADERHATGVWRRALPAWVAMDTRRLLAEVAINMEKVLKIQYPDESEWDYRIFGKSGTAQIPLRAAPEGGRRPKWSKGYYPDQYNSSFVAAGPYVSPRLVVLVVIDDPEPGRVRAKRHYGSWVAGPVARRFLERGLAYLGVAPDADQAD